MNPNQQNKIQEIGKEIFQRTEQASGPSIFNKDWWYGKVMDWSMSNSKFKTQMFRFVDVLPYLNSGSEVHRHLKEYFSESGDKLPSIFNFGVGMGALAPGLLAKSVRKNVTQMAKMFIAGEEPKDAMDELLKARKNNIGFTADILGEACLSEKEALEYQSRYIELMKYLAEKAPNWADSIQLDTNHIGSIPRVNVSVKLSALYSQIKITAWEESKQILKERLRPIFQFAKERNIFINLDLEKYEIKDLTFEVFKELITEAEFKSYPHLGIVVQAYLRDSYEEVVSLTEFAKQRGTPFSIRLVKGAYWDYETIDSEQKRWSYPVYTNKAESDANYEKCAAHLLENYQHIWLAIGSHNVRSISACIVKAQELNVPKNAFEIQMLYGMADQIKSSLVEMGYRVREYAPIGELIPGMAYLVRRLLENTSNESFLKSKFVDDVEAAVLLKDPADKLVKSNDFPITEDRFYNEAFLDFTLKENRDRMQKSLMDSKLNHNKEFPLVINNKKIKTDRLVESINPSNSDEIIGKTFYASTVEADLAIQAAKEAKKTWSKTSADERAEYLDSLAKKILERRFELIALEVREVGKTWKEADGDITEAVDFCRYYAREMRRLSKGKKVGNVPGEISIYQYRPRGISLVIAPWNFPLAILTGLVTSSIVTGNTVIMKPAEQSSITAALLMEMIEEIKLPAGVVNFLAGYGEEIGEYLVNHAEINNIAFTGSKEVGLKIVQSASQTLPGQKMVKRCVIEMGGKNAVIIDNDADLDVAVQGVMYSAFAFSGQKCSACSRVIVVDDIYDRFVDRLVEATKSIKVAAAEHPNAYLGPVIDETSQQRILKAIDEARKTNTILFESEVSKDGYFVSPTIIADVKASDPIAQNELFGPVLAIIKASDLEEAVSIANSTEYALTGGVFSRSPANIEYVKQNLEVGNLYINRNITGALVERHPFGGYKMSGVGSKAGGPDYLLQFMDPVVVIENTLRQGFAPAEEESEEQTKH